MAPERPTPSDAAANPKWKRRRGWIGLAILVVLASLVVADLARRPRPVPIAIFPMTSEEASKASRFSFEKQNFRISNHTDVECRVSYPNFETKTSKAGVGWETITVPSGMNEFRLETLGGGPMSFVPPHGTAYVVIPRPDVPPETPWRVSFPVLSQLKGLDLVGAMSAQVMFRAQTGNTNVPWIPAGMNYMGSRSNVLSPEMKVP